MGGCADIDGNLEKIKEQYPKKFANEETIFRNIKRGARIFIGTACGEPQYLVSALTGFVSSHPKAFFDAEIYHVWTLGVAPYAQEKFKSNFRHNSFFIGNDTRSAVNKGMADFTPISLSAIPDLFRRGLVQVDVALIQVSPPDEHGYLSLGVSVDIVKAAVEKAGMVIAQINSYMPRVHGDTFLHCSEVDYFICHNEPLLEYEPKVSDEIAHRIGKYVARLVEDGDTLQVGYGSIPNAIMANLTEKKHLGIHTELLSDGIIDLIKLGVVDNSKKTLNRGKTVASFCMGKQATYEFIDDNPTIEFRTIDYTNSALTISRQANMTAINSALMVDLTGQASAESIGRVFYSGIGGQLDFMRGTVFSPRGKTILCLQATADNGSVSRIVPFLPEGTGVTLNRSDIHYMVTEYGIAYLHGKNIRERAMALIAIAHPKFRPWLIQEAKKENLIFKDQAFIPGKRGEYPEEFEFYRTTHSDTEIFLRPVKISDEPLIKDFFYGLSDKSLYRRFMSARKDMPHERLQDFVIIDYTRELVILAVIKESEDNEIVAGLGQYGIDDTLHTAEAAVVVRDDFQHRGIATELIGYLTFLAKKQGLLGFTAEVLMENLPMMHLLEKMGYDMDKKGSDGVYKIRMSFR